MKFRQFLRGRFGPVRTPVKPEEEFMRRQRFTPMGEFDERDIFVCGWPKSGNTWCQRLFSGVVWGLDTSVLTDQLAQFLQPDVHYKPYYYRFKTPMMWKSHHLPQRNYRRVIHLVRDGRDALVSYWKMLRRADPRLELEQLLLKGEGLFPSTWETHASQWHENPFDADMVTIRYEDLLKDTTRELGRVAEFIGVHRTHDELSRIAAGASFEKMRNIAAESGWDNHSETSRGFLRQGRSGDHLVEMSDHVRRVFEERAGSMLELYGYPLVGQTERTSGGWVPPPAGQTKSRE